MSRQVAVSSSSSIKKSLTLGKCSGSKRVIATIRRSRIHIVRPGVYQDVIYAEPSAEIDPVHGAAGIGEPNMKIATTSARTQKRYMPDITACWLCVLECPVGSANAD